MPQSERPESSANVGPDALVDALFEGKETIRPLYDYVRAQIELLGEDVSLEPKPAYVAFSRDRQFAAVRPFARELELGLVVPDAAATTRFQEAGAFGSGSMTHRVTIVSEADVDGELLVWLSEAYQAAAG